MKKVIIVFSCLILLCGCNKKDNYDPYEMPEDVQINLNENKFNVYEEHTSKELVKDSNVEILSDDKLINDKVGVQKYTINYKYNDRKCI